MSRALSLTASALLLALPALAANAAPAMSAGEYVAKLGDCAACHTSETSKPLVDYSILAFDDPGQPYSRPRQVFPLCLSFPPLCTTHKFVAT